MKKLIIARKIVAGTVLFAFFLLFAAGAVPGLEKLAGFQAGPALLAGSPGFLGLLVVLTALFGRVYCSLLCPLGISQDCIGLVRKKGTYRPLAKNLWLRLAILALFAAALASGYLFVFEVLDPYAAFGRIAAAIFGPIIAGLNNLCAWLAGLFGSNAFTAREIVFHGWPALVAALITLGLLVGLVLKHGRIWCNYCPVGTALGAPGYRALFRVRLDPDKCVSCGLCQKSCKTGCIDIKKGEIDNSRCVSCLDCVAVCPEQALAYGAPQKDRTMTAPRDSRRLFLRSLAPLALAASAMPDLSRAADYHGINRPDVVPVRREPRQRDVPITPPGSQGLAHFAAHCAGCQLCVQACPNDVLRTSAQGPGLLQPAMSYEAGYCRPNCAKCGDVCPAGAIDKISLSAKKNIQIGLAEVDINRCIVHVDEVQCTACERICPQKAISLKSSDAVAANLEVPSVDAAKCTGCGACEYVCPAKPLAAIAVSGFREHKKTAAG